jgi:hypothetical protein
MKPSHLRPLNATTGSGVGRKGRRDAAEKEEVKTYFYTIESID